MSVILKVIQSSAPSLSLKSLFHPQLDCIKKKKVSKNWVPSNEIRYHFTMFEGYGSDKIWFIEEEEYKEQQKGNLNKQVIA